MSYIVLLLCYKGFTKDLSIRWYHCLTSQPVNNPNQISFHLLIGFSSYRVLSYLFSLSLVPANEGKWTKKTKFKQRIYLCKIGKDIKGIIDHTWNSNNSQICLNLSLSQTLLIPKSNCQLGPLSYPTLQHRDICHKNMLCFSAKDSSCIQAYIENPKFLWPFTWYYFHRLKVK